MFGFIGLNEFTGGGGGQPTSTVITVGDGTVNGRQYERYYRDVVARVSQQQGRPITYPDAKREGIVRQVNQALVQQEIYAQALRDLGIMPPVSVIQQQLSRLSPAQLQQLLQNRGVSRADFAEAVQREIARQQLLGTVSDVRFTPKSVADRLYRLRNEQRAATIIMVPLASIKKVPDATEPALAAYYEKNKDKYKLDTYRVVTALIIRPKDLDPLIKITGDMIRKMYQQQRAQFTTPERREVHQFVVKDAALAKKVAAALKEGRKFESVAEEIAKQKIDSLGLKPVAEVAKPGNANAPSGVVRKAGSPTFAASVRRASPSPAGAPRPSRPAPTTAISRAWHSRRMPRRAGSRRSPTPPTISRPP